MKTLLIIILSSLLLSLSINRKVNQFRFIRKYSINDCQIIDSITGKREFSCSSKGVKSLISDLFSEDVNEIRIEVNFGYLGGYKRNKFYANKIGDFLEECISINIPGKDIVTDSRLAKFSFNSDTIINNYGFEKNELLTKQSFKKLDNKSKLNIHLSMNYINIYAK